MTTRHYRSSTGGISGYVEGDILHDDDTGERVRAVMTGKGIQLEPVVRGRPPRAESAGKPVTIRATESEIAAWTAAAGDDSLSEWIRRTLTSAAQSAEIADAMR